MKYDKIDILIEKYIDGGLSKKEFDEFERKIIADESFKKELTQRIEIHQLLAIIWSISQVLKKGKRLKESFQWYSPGLGISGSSMFHGCLLFCHLYQSRDSKLEKILCPTHMEISEVWKGRICRG